MAGSSLLTLFDDIATILDDVAVMSKTAATKTAGVLGDDLALSAEQVNGVKADRELPVVWAVAKGSMVNKMILVPGALLVSAFAPWVIGPMLAVGGAYLCFEGFEKIAHKLFHGKDEAADKAAELKRAVANPVIDLVAFEKQKIKGAIKMDGVLSFEIIIIALGTVAGASLLNQFLVLSLVAVGVTVVTYGLVGAIIRMDDVGFYLKRQKSTVKQVFGDWLIQLAPKLMKTLSVVGVAAMLAVGGQLVLHSIPTIAHALELSPAVLEIPVAGKVLDVVAPTIINGLFGVVAGAVVLGAVSLASKVKSIFFKPKAA
jgi:predicted DNA repair protein MutK